jgi:hypothetical protein
MRSSGTGPRAWGLLSYTRYSLVATRQEYVPLKEVVAIEVSEIYKTMKYHREEVGIDSLLLLGHSVPTN